MEGKNFFLADDDPDDIEIFEYALKEVDPTIHCLTATDGEEAVTKLSTTAPDVIFLDLNMPKVSGAQCLTQLRKMKHLDSIPIVIYTTSQNPDHKDETLRLGASCFLTKPSEFDDLCKSLKYIVRKLEANPVLNSNKH